MMLGENCRRFEDGLVAPRHDHQFPPILHLRQVSKHLHPVALGHAQVEGKGVRVRTQQRTLEVRNRFGGLSVPTGIFGGGNHEFAKDRLIVDD